MQQCVSVDSGHTDRKTDRDTETDSFSTASDADELELSKCTA